MDMIWIAAGVLGIGGIGIWALLFFFAPAALAVVMQFIIQFVNSRVGLALVLCAAGAIGGDLYRAAIDAGAQKEAIAKVNSDWQAKEDKAAEDFKNARKERDKSVTDDLKAADDKRQAELDAKDKEMADKLAAYAKTLKADPNCIITPDDLQR